MPFAISRCVILKAMSSPAHRRLLILTTKLGYQTRAFVDAAQKLGLEIVFGTDRCGKMDDPWGDHAVPLKFEHPDDAARRVLQSPDLGDIHAVVSLGDRPTPTAARIAHALRLPHHSAAAADACRDKYRSREILRRAGLQVPRFVRLGLDISAAELCSAIADGPGFPCVLKPLALSGSRGVIRANDDGEARAAFDRIRALLRSKDVRVLREESSDFIQVESYVDGDEIAVEALVDRGKLRVLAIFDKPDPLTGPFFEETIYVTPSRLSAAQQGVIVETLERSVAALGLSHGPIHAELRVNALGAWPMEIAARSIGGLCSRALRFTLDAACVKPGDSPAPRFTAHTPDLHSSVITSGRSPRGICFSTGEKADASATASPRHDTAMKDAGNDGLHSLEEIIIRLALGESMDTVARERAASGVMMIPIPDAGIYHGVEGVEAAEQVEGIDEIRITAKPEQKLVPLPEGASYLGFIFARAQSPAQVEAALRAAHSKLHFQIGAALPVV